MMEAFIGTYTDTDSKGIYRCLVEETTGELTNPELIATTENPSFLTFDPDRQVLYSVNELETGAVSAYAINGKEVALLDRRTIAPSDPCYCSIDATGQVLLVAHYTGGAVSLVPLKSDGTFGEPKITHHAGSSVHPKRQTAPHPHAAVPSPNNQFVYVPDLGTDEVVRYELDLDARKLHRRGATSIKAGSGPRHLTFDPEQTEAFLINELDSTITSFNWEPGTGVLRPTMTVNTLPDGIPNTSTTADIKIHPSGKFIYGSNRGHDTIAVFERTVSGLKRLDTVDVGGSSPRSLSIGPTGDTLFAANRVSNSITSFTIEQNGALLQHVDQVSVPRAACLCLV